jgi:hypothetical protein
MESSLAYSLWLVGAYLILFVSLLSCLIIWWNIFLWQVWGNCQGTIYMDTTCRSTSMTSQVLIEVLESDLRYENNVQNLFINIIFIYRPY